MPQVPESVDTSFVESLKTDISGIFSGQIAHYTPEKITDEFRKAVRDPSLMADEAFAPNLFFLVRKKEVRDLLDDVSKQVSGNQLKPAAQVSALKTMYALGGANERNVVDYLVSQALAQLVQSGQPPESSPYVAAAERIGGPRTLVALQRLNSDAASRQRAAEQQSPGNHALIGRLDKVRTSLEGKAYLLGRKQAIAVKPDAERTADLARVYLRRTAGLACWAYRELMDQATPEAGAAVEAVVSRELPGFLPTSGLTPEDRAKRLLDLQLRGVALLERMNATLTDPEWDLLNQNRSMMLSRESFFYPKCDWEEILDAS